MTVTVISKLLAGSISVRRFKMRRFTMLCLLPLGYVSINVNSTSQILMKSGKRYLQVQTLPLAMVTKSRNLVR